MATAAAKAAAQPTAPSFDIQDGFLVIRIPLQPPTPSASGKTKVVATTHGNITTTATVDGKPVIVGLNAYIKA